MTRTPGDGETVSPGGGPHPYGTNLFPARPRSYAKRAPAPSPVALAQSAAGVFLPPAGRTRLTRICPSAVATCTPSSPTRVTWPGWTLLASGILRLSKTATLTPSQVVQAPGAGLQPGSGSRSCAWADAS